MGKGDNRKTRKMRRRKGQEKSKQRQAAKINQAAK
jgi:hypothetical protein